MSSASKAQITDRKFEFRVATAVEYQENFD
jgi:hypothetical protein